MATFSDYADEIALILDDDPTAPPAAVLAFEESVHPSRIDSLENAFAYRDWLEERGCSQRIEDINAKLADTLELTQKALAEVASADVKEWLSARLAAVKDALAGVEVKRQRPLKGVGILRWPANGLTTAEGVNRSREVAREMAENIHAGSVLCLPSTRDHEGNYLWDFRIEGGDPGQVKIERSDGD